MTFEIDRAHPLLFIAAFIGTPFGVFIAAVAGTEGAVLPAVLFGGILCAPAVTIGVAASLENVGRGRTWRSRVLRTAAPYISAGLRGCGCVVHDDSEGRYGTDYRPHYDTVEEQDLVLKADDGARMTFERATEELRRCHRCGRHYHSVERSGSLAEVWPEDAPDRNDQYDVPVVDKETVIE